MRSLRTMRTPRGGGGRARARLVGVLGIAAATLALSGCATDPAESEAEDRQPGASAPAGGADGGEVGDAGSAPGVPEECAKAFPMAFGEPDIAEVDLRPGDWPEPVGDAVLCSTSSTVGDGQQNADYATTATPAEVLDAFEAALRDRSGYQVVRDQPPGLGHEVVTGQAGDVGFQVDPRDGGYKVTFVAS